MSRERAALVRELEEVTPAARWRRDTTPVELAGITRVDVGGGYDLALLSVAGPPPRRPG